MTRKALGQTAETSDACGPLAPCFSDGLFDLLGGNAAAFDDVTTVVAASPTAGEIVHRLAALAEAQVLTDDVTVVVIRRQASPSSA